MHSIKYAVLAGAAAAGLACGGGGAPETTLAMFKHLGSVQCTGGGVSLAALERELVESGISVAAAACGLDGNAYPALCGAPDGRIGIFEIAQRHSDLAAALGFEPLGNLPAAVRAPCP